MSRRHGCSCSVTAACHSDTGKALSLDSWHPILASAMPLLGSSHFSLAGFILETPPCSPGRQGLGSNLLCYFLVSWRPLPGPCPCSSCGGLQPCKRPWLTVCANRADTPTPVDSLRKPLLPSLCGTEGGRHPRFQRRKNSIRLEEKAAKSRAASGGLKCHFPGSAIIHER